MPLVSTNHLNVRHHNWFAAAAAATAVVAIICSIFRGRRSTWRSFMLMWRRRMMRWWWGWWAFRTFAMFVFIVMAYGSNKIATIYRNIQQQQQQQKYIQNQLFDLPDDDELSLSPSLTFSLSFRTVAVPDDTWFDVELDELDDDVECGERFDLAGDDIEWKSDLDFFDLLHSLQCHDNSCPFVKSPSLICGLWHSWW